MNDTGTAAYNTPRDAVEAIRSEVAKVVIGKQDVTDKILMAMLAGGHVLLDDVPGTGKTTTALAFSRAMGLSFNRVQFTPDVVPSDVTGYSVYDRSDGRMRYVPGAAMCNLLLADEINRTSSKTQAALLEVMAEGQVTVDGTTHELPKPFVVIATQNPVGSAGTQLLPESQLDRFMVRLSMGYPERSAEIGMLADRQTQDPLDDARPVIDAQGFFELRARVAAVEIGAAVLGYVCDLAQATRDDELVVLGVSPRGSLALSRMAKARAWMAGRDYVIPEDVEDVFTCTCAHRLVPGPKARVAGLDDMALASGVLERVPKPAAGIEV